MHVLTSLFPEMDLWWEMEILEVIKNDPDDRTIYWYWSDKVVGCGFAWRVKVRPPKVGLGGSLFVSIDDASHSKFRVLTIKRIVVVE